MIKRKISRFIPSQRIKGSDKELFIINYEGSTFEIQRTSNLYEPAIIRLNGELLDTIPSKQNKEIEFSTPAGKHKIQVWNERVENNLIPKIFVKDGVAVVIDGVPVQDTLADPVTRFKSGKAFIWLLTALLFLKAFIIPLSSNQFLIQDETNVFQFVNIILFVLSLSAALTFQLNPLRAVWIALIVSTLEFASYILALFAIKEIDVVIILSIVLRLSILAALILSLRNLKLILDFSDEEYLVTSEKSPIQKKVKRFSFSKKYVVISLITLAILIGCYFAITEIIKSSKYPSIERDSSLEFRIDLKLPELIPYKKGDLWGYCDNDKNIVIQPIYNDAEIPFSISNRLIVNYKGKYGVIDGRGEKIIPFKYEDIRTDGKKFIAKFNDYEGLLSYNGEILIPFKYYYLTSFGNNYIACIKLGNSNLGQVYGIIDSLGRNITEFNFASLDEINDSLTIGYRITNYIKNKYGKGWDSWEIMDGIIDFNGSIILPFNHYNISEIYNPNYLSFGKERNDLSYKGMRLWPNTYVGVMDISGKQIIPPIYSSVWGQSNYSYFIIKKEGGIGVIDLNNTVVIPNQYKDIVICNIRDDDIIFMCEDNFGYKGILNKLGEVVIPFHYTDLIAESDESKNQFNADILIAEKELNHKDKKYGFINLKNEMINDFIWENVESFAEGYATVELNKKWGVINKINQTVLPFKYDKIDKVTDYDLYKVRLNGKEGYVDLNGVEYFDN